MRLTANGDPILLKQDLKVFGELGLLLYTQGFPSEAELVEQGRSSNVLVHVIDLETRENYKLKNAYKAQVW